MDGISELTEALRQFAEERNWGKFHDPKNFAMALTNEAGELAAPFTWANREESFVLCQDPAMRPKIKGEVGDVMINLLQFCRLAGIDPLEAARDKLAELEARYRPEEQIQAGGYVRKGEDGTVRERISR